jgi:hypothetical protein
LGSSARLLVDVVTAVATVSETMRSNAGNRGNIERVRQERIANYHPPYTLLTAKLADKKRQNRAVER